MDQNDSIHRGKVANSITATSPAGRTAVAALDAKGKVVRETAGGLAPVGYAYDARGRMREVAAMLKAIHAQEDRQAALEKTEAVAKKLDAMKLKGAAKILRDGGHETLSYYAFPSTHWRSIKTNNPLERIMREIRRRTRVVGAFPDGNAALMPVSARLRHIASSRWGTRQYLGMDRLYEAEKMAKVG